MLALGLILDAIFGEPEWLWRRVAHPARTSRQIALRTRLGKGLGADNLPPPQAGCIVDDLKVVTDDAGLSRKVVDVGDPAVLDVLHTVGARGVPVVLQGTRHCRPIKHGRELRQCGIGWNLVRCQRLILGPADAE